MSRACVAVVALTLLALIAGGCRINPRKGTGRADRVAVANGKSLEGLARSSRLVRDRSSRFLAAAKAYLREGKPRDALRCASSARHRSLKKDARAEIDRVLGEAHLRVGELSLAARYLARGLNGARGLERDRTLAFLVVCHGHSSQHATARRYRDQIAMPHDPAVRLALSVEPNSAPDPYRQRKAPRVVQAPLPPTPPAQGPMPPRIASELPAVTVLPRWKWSASSIGRNTRPMTRVRRITVHHSGPPKDSHAMTTAAAAAEIRRIQRHHQNHNRWADIGYHYIVDRAGQVWQGRPMKYQGAHASGKNEGNIGIVVLGNYERGHQHLTQEQQRSLTLLVARLSDLFGVSPREVYTHREITGPTHTRCPGPEITAYVARIRNALEQRLIAMRQSPPATHVARRGK